MKLRALRARLRRLRSGAVTYVADCSRPVSVVRYSVQGALRDCLPGIVEVALPESRQKFCQYPYCVDIVTAAAHQRPLKISAQPSDAPHNGQDATGLYRSRAAIEADCTGSYVVGGIS